MGFHRWRSGARTWKVLKSPVRSMRREPTEEEALLWERLRDRQVAGAKFRCQHGIGKYAADLCCPEAMLVIEVDGSIHDLPDIRENDKEKQEYLEAMGFRVLRFRNEEVTKELDRVVRDIEKLLTGPPTK